MPQYGGQTRGQGQQGQQGPQSQQGGSQYGGQNPAQQDPSQYGEQQDQSQYGAQDPSGGYSGQDQSPQQYGQPQDPSNSYQQGLNGQDQDQQDPSQYGQESQNEHGHAQQKPAQQHQQQKQHAVNGHNEEPEDEDEATTKPSSHTAVQGRKKGKGYHSSHLNALHYMSAAATNGFTPEHIESLLHLGTYAMGALANTHGLAPAKPVEE